ncbi:hypothetical protein ACFYMW_25255 [Streptomyces sp. NPDC006692]|uniref:hypothetical protein n=1 Tax=unclassified Streptomyces TaxID=2593676 RepID=UPI00342AA1E6
MAMHSFPHSLTRTAPGGAWCTGALLIESLTRQGLHVRVVRPYKTSAEEYLVCTAPGRDGRRVWVDAYDSDGRGGHYDIGRDMLWSLNATVMDDRGTRHVFWGADHPHMRPLQQAEACAIAVATFFGLPVVELGGPVAEPVAATG